MSKKYAHIKAAGGCMEPTDGTWDRVSSSDVSTVVGVKAQLAAVSIRRPGE